MGTMTSQCAACGIEAWADQTPDGGASCEHLEIVHRERESAASAARHVRGRIEGLSRAGGRFEFVRVADVLRILDAQYCTCETNEPPSARCAVHGIGEAR